jgi:hypothetical protein
MGLVKTLCELARRLAARVRVFVELEDDGMVWPNPNTVRAALAGGAGYPTVSQVVEARRFMFYVLQDSVHHDLLLPWLYTSTSRA